MGAVPQNLVPILEARQKKYGPLSVEVFGWVDEFLQEWELQAGDAVVAAQKPGQDSDNLWFVALAGNIVWAVAAFTPAGWAAFGVSIAGIGIGTLSAFGSPGTDTSIAGIKLVTNAITQVRMALRDDAKSHAIDLAEKVFAKFDKMTFKDDLAKQEEAKKWVWEEFVFANIPYGANDKIEQILIQVIESALSDFKVSYNMWTMQLMKCMMENGYDEKYCRKTTPFFPYLNFSRNAAALR